MTHASEVRPTPERGEGTLTIRQVALLASVGVGVALLGLLTAAADVAGGGFAAVLGGVLLVLAWRSRPAGPWDDVALALTDSAREVMDRAVDRRSTSAPAATSPGRSHDPWRDNGRDDLERCDNGLDGLRRRDSRLDELESAVAEFVEALNTVLEHFDGDADADADDAPNAGTLALCVLAHVLGVEPSERGLRALLALADRAHFSTGPSTRPGWRAACSAIPSSGG